jgi:hypothetical protein
MLVIQSPSLILIGEFVSKCVNIIVAFPLVKCHSRLVRAQWIVIRVAFVMIDQLVGYVLQGTRGGQDEKKKRKADHASFEAGATKPMMPGKI